MMLNVGNLSAHGEADEVSPESKPGSLTRCNANAGRNEVEQDENACSNDTESEDLAHHELLLGDEHSSEGHSETLNQVLDYTGDEIREEAVHFVYSYIRKKPRQCQRLNSYM